MADERQPIVDIGALSERQRDLLHSCLVSQARSYRRKRSWRPSEVAMAQASVEELGQCLGLPSIFKGK